MASISDYFKYSHDIGKYKSQILNQLTDFILEILSGFKMVNKIVSLYYS
jgi:hypothetical protein